MGFESILLFCFFDDGKLVVWFSSESPYCDRVTYRAGDGQLKIVVTKMMKYDKILKAEVSPYFFNLKIK